MVTKDEERKALAKIKKIMSELTNNGQEETYIGYAFKEVIDDATFNIANDAAVSKADSANFWMAESDSYQRKAKELEEENKALKDTVSELQAKMYSVEECQKVVETIHHCKVAFHQFDNKFKADIIDNLDNMDSEPFVKARANHLEMVELLNGLDEMMDILKGKQ